MEKKLAAPFPSLIQAFHSGPIVCIVSMFLYYTVYLIQMILTFIEYFPIKSLNMSHVIRKPVLCYMQTTLSAEQPAHARSLISAFCSIIHTRINALYKISSAVAEPADSSLIWLQAFGDRFYRDVAYIYHLSRAIFGNKQFILNLSTSYVFNGC